MERPYNSLDVSGLAKLFAPPSVQDIYAGTQAQALRQKIGMQQSIWNAASAPGATLPGLDTRAVAAGLYNPSQSAWSVQQNNQRALQENAANNQTSITNTAMGPLSQGQTRYVPPAVAKALGVPVQQFGVQNVAQGSTLTLPDARGGIQGETDDGTNPNKTISGGDAPLSETQLKAKIMAGAPQDLQTAWAFSNTPVDAVLGENGVATNVTRPESLGKTPATPAQPLTGVPYLQAQRAELLAKGVPATDQRVQELNAAIAAGGRGQTADPLDTKIKGGIGDMILEDMKGGDAGQAELHNVQLAREAILRGGDNLFTGPGAAEMLKAKQFFSNLTGRPLDGTSEAETLNNIGFTLATQATKELTSRPALLEFQKAYEIKPGLGLTKQGSLIALAIKEQAAKDKIALAQMAADPKYQGANWPQVKQAYYAQHPVISPFTGKPLSEVDLQALQQAAPTAPGIRAPAATAGAAPAMQGEGFKILKVH